MEGSIRINKYLSEAGVCSRREADRQIEKGAVTINGRTAAMGDKVAPGDLVMYGNQRVSPEGEAILLAVNKPPGIVCTSENGNRTILWIFWVIPNVFIPLAGWIRLPMG